MFSECGGNISGQLNGVIHSPNYPEKYAESSEGSNLQCNWFIHVSPGHKIVLYFETLEIEGKPDGKYYVQLWQYGLWSFQTGDTKLERFLPKNQHTQRKLLNFEF